MLPKIGAAAIVASLALMGAASAAPIDTTFNFVPTTTLTANTGNVTTATTITDGAPLLVTSIITDNTGLVSLSTIVDLTSPTPVTMGAQFTKSWATTLGTFTANLTVTQVSRAATSLGIDATGTVTSTDPLLTSSPDFYSASYTQNGGPGAQINASFNNSTTRPTPPPPIPEPTSIALLGVGLLGLGATVRRRSSANLA
jgi:hypothetical protein